MSSPLKKPARIHISDPTTEYSSPIPQQASPSHSTPDKGYKAGVYGVLDIGSTKISCVIARCDPHGNFRMIGYGWQQSKGVRNGQIIDTRTAERDIRAAVAQAEKSADRRLEKVYVNLSCGDPESRVYSIHWHVQNKIVTDSDIRRSIHEGILYAETDSRTIIHEIPLKFTVDRTPDIADPRGYPCKELITHLHIIDTDTTSLQLLYRVLTQAELEISGLVSSGIASGLAVLDQDEKELGSIVIDMGGGNTSIAVFYEGDARFTAQIPLGGDNITRDIAQILSTTLDNAESLKTRFGSMQRTFADERELLSVQHIGDNSQEFFDIPRSRLTAIIQPRVEEILLMIRDRLETAHLGRAAGQRVILTGGGAQLDGIIPIAGNILNRRVRLGYPSQVSGLPDNRQISTIFSTSVGLLIWAAGAGQRLASQVFIQPRPANFLKRLANYIREHI